MFVFKQLFTIFEACCSITIVIMFIVLASAIYNLSSHHVMIVKMPTEQAIRVQASTWRVQRNTHKTLEHSIIRKEYKAIRFIALDKKKHFKKILVGWYTGTWPSVVNSFWNEFAKIANEKCGILVVCWIDKKR